MWRRFYHVTHADRVESIIELGLSPAFAKGRLKAVWLADSKRIHWAIAHVAVKHNFPIADLWVALVHYDPRDLKRFRWPGIYLAERTIPIYEIYPAADLINRGPLRMAGNRSKI